MSKYSGHLGFFLESKEDPPGIWMPAGVVEKEAKGDVLRASRSFNTTTESSNDNLEVDNQISIIMNPYINDNLDKLRYVTLYGNRWKIKNIAINRPRLLLTIGGLYNGELPKQ